MTAFFFILFTGSHYARQKVLFHGISLYLLSFKIHVYEKNDILPYYSPTVFSCKASTTKIYNA